LGKLVVISGSKSDIHIINIYARAREEFIPYIGGVSFTHVRRPTPSEHRRKTTISLQIDDAKKRRFLP